MSHLLFHKTLANFKSENLNSKKILIGVSAGVDSVVLLDVLSSIASPQNLELLVVYIHHGEASNADVNTYRQKAAQLVAAICLEKSLSFIESAQPKSPLKSEEDFRNFRYEQFQKILKKEQGHWVALAHNSDDVLETQLLQLIRGCGEEGLKGMKQMENPLLRPFLPFSRKTILDYARKKELKWLEDPSNLDSDFLRNWLRKKWLPLLEEKRPGSCFRLGQSLSQIASAFFTEENSFSQVMTAKGISRNLFRELSLFNQKRLLALYMKKNEIKNYGQSHIMEILKHLDRADKSINLNLLKRNWKITEAYFCVESEASHK